MQPVLVLLPVKLDSFTDLPKQLLVTYVTCTLIEMSHTLATHEQLGSKAS